MHRLVGKQPFPPLHGGQHRGRVMLNAADSMLFQGKTCRSNTAPAYWRAACGAAFQQAQLFVATEWNIEAGATLRSMSNAIDEYARQYCDKSQHPYISNTSPDDHFNNGHLLALHIAGNDVTNQGDKDEHIYDRQILTDQDFEAIDRLAVSTSIFAWSHCGRRIHCEIEVCMDKIRENGPIPEDLLQTHC